MGDGARPWAIDAGLARELSDALGWRAADGPSALAALMPAFVPMGSTAKLAAIDRGEVPPGADVEALARSVLGGRTASPSYSCWVASTVMAALVDGAGLGPVHVAATRRCDAAAPMVDFHAAVVVDDPDGGSWICDPYFGVSVALPAEAEARASATGSTGTTAATRSTDGGWHYDLGLDVWDIVLRFRCFGPALDRGDVRAMAAVSVTHTGVPLRPYARVHLGDGIDDASEAADGTGVLHRWTAAEGRQEHVVASWPDAVEVFAERTGTRII